MKGQLEESGGEGVMKRVLGPLAHLATLLTYTALGGLVFKELEYPVEVQRLAALEVRVVGQRAQLIAALTNRSQLTEDETDGLLADYEAAVQEAAQGGLLVPFSQGQNSPALAKWTYLQAIFFASTVLTTIGYGNVTPGTVEGRLFCMVFALVGIPLTVSVLADLGVVLARRLPTPPEALTLRTSLTSAAIATSILLVYIAIGSCLFISWETEWTFFDGFYFCFVTMTTIGFGDLVPSTPQYMLMCTVYIILGLSLTSTIIEVVRQQYSHSWRHLQALAESLGELAAERGTMDVNLQVDLKRILSFYQSERPRDLQKAVKQMSQELKKCSRPRVVQIIVYESSV